MVPLGCIYVELNRKSSKNDIILYFLTFVIGTNLMIPNLVKITGDYNE